VSGPAGFKRRGRLHGQPAIRRYTAASGETGSAATGSAATGSAATGSAATEPWRSAAASGITDAAAFETPASGIPPSEKVWLQLYFSLPTIRSDHYYFFKPQNLKSKLVRRPSLIDLDLIDFFLRRSTFLLLLSRVARFFLVQTTKTGKMYVPNNHKVYQMSIKYNKRP
jgi:hypothetical protein